MASMNQDIPPGFSVAEEQRIFKERDKAAADKYDYSDAPRPEPPSDQYGQLKEAVLGMKITEDNIDDAEGRLKALKELYAEYRDHKVPDLARAMSLYKAEIGDIQMDVKVDVVGGVPKDPVERAAAFDHLREIGEDKLVKRFITVELGRDSTAIARAIQQAIAAVAPSVPVTEEVTVHHMQYLAMARERGRKGLTIDLKKLGLVELWRAKLKKI